VPSGASGKIALEEALLRLDAPREEAAEKLAHAETRRAELDPATELAALVDAARAAAAQDRATVAEASANLQTQLREAETHKRRLGGLKEERQSWLVRSERAKSQIDALEERCAEAAQELRKLKEAQELFISTRQTLQIETAEEARRRTGSRSAGRTHVPAPRLDQDFGRGLFVAARDHTGAAADAVVHSRPAAARIKQPCVAGHAGALSARLKTLPSVSKDDRAAQSRLPGDDGASCLEARESIHATVI
jgi:hypothetical protein